MDAAAERGDIAAVRKLYAQHPPIDNAIELAARNGHIGVVRLLCEKIDTTPHLSLIMRGAAHNDDVDMVRLLCTEYRLDSAEVHDAFYAAVRGDSVEVMRMLHEEFGPMDVNRALITAVKFGKIESARVLCLEMGATDVDTALREAAHCNQLEMARVLCAELGATAQTAANALYIAHYRCDRDMMQILMDACGVHE